MLIEPETDTKVKTRRKLYALLFIFISVICIAVVTFPLYFWRFSEFQTEQKFRIYADSEERFEVRGYDQSKLAQKNLYYWSKDDLAEVKRFYEQYYRPFKNGDSRAQWLITVINDDTSMDEVSKNFSILGLENFCMTKGNYGCATISLIDLATQKPENTTPALLPVGMQSKDELMTKIASLPSTGTLIVYSYYIANLK